MITHQLPGGETAGIIKAGPDIAYPVYCAARQVSTFMGGIQQGVYLDALGLEWEDDDPKSHPNNPGELNWRISALHNAHGLDIATPNAKTYHLAVLLDDDGSPRLDDNALAGLVRLGRQRPCTPTEHTPVVLDEWDVAEPFRGHGLGTMMLAGALAELSHPKDGFELWVHERNTRAAKIYTDKLGLKPSGVHQAQHIVSGEHIQLVSDKDKGIADILAVLQRLQHPKDA